MPILLNMNTHRHRRGASDAVYLQHGVFFGHRDGTRVKPCATHAPPTRPCIFAARDREEPGLRKFAVERVANLIFYGRLSCGELFDFVRCSHVVVLASN